MMYNCTVASAYQNLQIGESEMAKATVGVNKSEAIRQAYKALPNAKAKEIVAHLKGKGIEVTEGLVYQVKKISKKKKTGKKPAQAPMVTETIAPLAKIATPAKVVAPSSNGRLGVGASIVVAKAAAEKLGGWIQLKEIVDAMV
jgi:hypothetical protein